MATCYSGDSRTCLPGMAHDMGAEAHADQMEVAVVHARLQIEEAHHQRDLSPNHSGVLPTLAVETTRASAPVNKDDV